MKREIDLRQLKAFMMQRFPSSAPLRDAILGEKDQMTPEELLHKAEVWMKLLPNGR